MAAGFQRVVRPPRSLRGFAEGLPLKMIFRIWITATDCLPKTGKAIGWNKQGPPALILTNVSILMLTQFRQHFLAYSQNYVAQRNSTHAMRDERPRSSVTEPTSTELDIPAYNAHSCATHQPNNSDQQAQRRVWRGPKIREWSKYAFHDIPGGLTFEFRGCQTQSAETNG